MALEQAYGPGAHNRLESIQVQIGHPDATQALLNPSHEINSHFSAPPFQQIALKSPNVHTVLNSNDVLGGPATITGFNSAIPANLPSTSSAAAPEKPSAGAGDSATSLPPPV